MDFSEVIVSQRAEIGAVAPVNETEKAAVAVLTDSDIPLGMPLTTDLTKMTVNQGLGRSVMERLGLRI